MIRSFSRKPRAAVGFSGVAVALSAPLVQQLVRPFFENNFAFPVNRLVSLSV